MSPVLEQPDSRLLSLPAVRNEVYELLCYDITETTVAVGTEGPHISATSHPLRRACRQTRNELASISARAAEESARVLSIKVGNLNLPPRDLALRWLGSLPPLFGREFRQHLYLDGHFERYFETQVKHVLCDETSPVERASIKFTIVAHLDRKDCDIEQLRGFLRQARSQRWKRARSDRGFTCFHRNLTRNIGSFASFFPDQTRPTFILLHQVPLSLASVPSTISQVFEQQGSRLLNLPAELRNDIYSFVCCDVSQTTITNTARPHIGRSQHLLARACRQTLYEFAPIFVTAARCRATNFIIHARNFKLPRQKHVRAYLESLPRMRGRKVTQRVFLENNLSLGCEARAWIVILSPIMDVRGALVSPSLIIQFDPEEFDIKRLEILMRANAPRLDIYGLSSGKEGGATHMRKEQITWALEGAAKRYGQLAHLSLDLSQTNIPRQ